MAISSPWVGTGATMTGRVEEVLSAEAELRARLGPLPMREMTSLLPVSQG